MTGIRTCFALLPLFCAVGFPALAAPPKVGILVSGNDAEAAGVVQQALELGLQGSSEWVPIGARTLGPKLGKEQPMQPPLVDTSVIEAVDAGIEKVSTAYYSLEYKAAEDALKEVGTILEKHKHGLLGMRVQYHQWRTAVALAQKKTSDAERAATEALLLDRNAEVDLNKFPPEVAKVLAEQRQANPSVQISIDGVPDDSKVWVDGAPVSSTSPIRFDVTKGKHWLTVRTQGCDPIQREVRWMASTTESLALSIAMTDTLSDAVKRLAKGSKHGPVIDKVARGQAFDYLVVGYASGANMFVTVWNPSQPAQLVHEKWNEREVAGMKKWAAQEVGKMVRSARVAKATATPTPEPSATPKPDVVLNPPGGTAVKTWSERWDFVVDGSVTAVPAFRRQLITHTDPGATPQTITLRDNGIGLRADLRGARRLGRNSHLYLGGHYSYKGVNLTGTTVSNLARQGEPVQVIYGGQQSVFGLHAGYKRGIGERWRLGAAFGVKHTEHTAQDLLDLQTGTDAGVFTSYTRNALELRIDSDYEHAKLALNLGFAAGWGGVVEINGAGKAAPVLGSTDVASDFEITATARAVRTLGKRWRVGLGLEARGFRYELSGAAQASVVTPTPVNAQVNEVDATILFLFGYELF